MSTCQNENTDAYKTKVGMYLPVLVDCQQLNSMLCLVYNFWKWRKCLNRAIEGPVICTISVGLLPSCGWEK